MAIKSKKIKLTTREKRKKRLRKTLTGSDDKPRLCVFRSQKHIYAQLISDESNKTFVSASTLEDVVKSKIGATEVDCIHNEAKSAKSVAASVAVGKVIAERAIEKGIKKVVFDRNGFIYHGRIKGVAEGARKGGLDF